MTVGSNQSCGSAVSSIARALWAQMGNTGREIDQLKMRLGHLAAAP
jgi:hypothetical protein